MNDEICIQIQLIYCALHSRKVIGIDENKFHGKYFDVNNYYLDGLFPIVSNFKNTHA